MKEILKKLNDYWNYDKGDQVILSAIKLILVLLCGASIGVIYSAYNDGKTVAPKQLIIFVSTLVFYLILEARTIIKTKLFPLEIIGHLNALTELEDLKKQYIRKEKLDEYISNSITSLNNNTCPIQRESENSNQLCHQSIKDSLENVLSDLIQNTQNFLNSELKDYSVGIYIKTIYDPSWVPGNELNKPILLVLRDDFNLEEYFPEDMRYLNMENKNTYYIQTKIKESIDLQAFISERKIIEGKNKLFIFSPIPNVCDYCPPEGTIVIVSKQKENIPEDLENILRIFGQIVSNWVSKFNDCIRTDKKVEEYFKAKLQQIEDNKKVKNERV